MADQQQQFLDLEQQVRQNQELRRHRRHQQEELNDETVRLLDNLRQVHQQQIESWRQHLEPCYVLKISS
jgi:hypothetical protein